MSGMSTELPHTSRPTSAATALVPPATSTRATSSTPVPASAPRVLVIGGSVFLGRAFAEEALARGWSVTTFNRGRSAADPEGAESLRGDRTDPADLERLAAAGPWDVVVDVCGYAPVHVSASARALAGAASCYLFVSSVSAIQGWPEKPVDGGTPLLPGAPDAGPDDGDYGTLKAACERALVRDFPGRTLILAPGLIIGPGDLTGRATWWIERAARGGDFVAGGGPERPVQLIDARDIAAFGLDRALAPGAADDAPGAPGAPGAADGGAGSERFLVAAEPEGGSWGEFLDACVAATGGRARPVWIPDDFLLDHEVGVWNELPLWAPDRPEFDGVWKPDSGPALRAGLTPRPLADSVRDTWAWLERDPDARARIARYAEDKRAQGLAPAGMDPSREAGLLAAWRSREAASRG